MMKKAMVPKMASRMSVNQAVKRQPRCDEVMKPPAIGPIAGLILLWEGTVELGGKDSRKTYRSRGHQRHPLRRRKLPQRAQLDPTYQTRPRQ